MAVLLPFGTPDQLELRAGDQAIKGTGIKEI
jgi:hypothetical protein